MIHDLMKRVAVSDRRLSLISELQVTLTAADKEAIKAAMVAKAATLDVDASKLSSDIPNTCARTPDLNVAYAFECCKGF